MKTDRLMGDVIVLHSTKLLNRATKLIEQNQYSIINTYLDNDATGRKAVAELTKEYGNRIIDQSDLYTSYKDLNSCWMIAARNTLNYIDRAVKNHIN
jgi:hypothetical protein